MNKEKIPLKKRLKNFFATLEKKKVPILIGTVVLVSFMFYQNLTCGRAEYSFSNVPSNSVSASGTGADGNGFLSANLVQKEETFGVKTTTPVSIEVPAPVDLLFVLDNSASMRDDQAKLVSSFQSFADTYFNSSRDVRIARITTDAYKAGTRDADCSQSTWCDQNNSLLVVGWADGSNPREDGTGRSGKPVLSTIPPANYSGTPTQWTSQLKIDFDINTKVGTHGHSIEKGMQSLHKFFVDNESRPSCKAIPITDPQCFFRRNTARVIVIVSDEKDSTVFTGAPSSNASSDAVINYNTEYLKNYVSSFFRNLDVDSVNPNFMVVTVTSNQTAKNKAYVRLVDLIKGDATNSLASKSFTSLITDADFNSLLSTIGQTIEETVNVTTFYSTFTLAETPKSFNDVAVYGIDSQGNEALIASSAYQIVGRDLLFMLSLDSLMSGIESIRVAYAYQD